MLYRAICLHFNGYKIMAKQPLTIKDRQNNLSKYVWFS
ncbi:hypothetical protein FQV37_151 [Psychrobacter nivimaris]|uniref:Uncharacterized protein n=1 Tax=Psychrobacter nivimaris TaxID=281738 RepID=A0A6N7C042_9GAMM|nr:hypothetical protein FQV37_151 [Psychrobacter nivimaris]